jgi:hypothetical protein
LISLIFLLPLYFIGIQYERGGWWRVFISIAFIALILDIILNYTEWVLMTLQFPALHDYTISKRIKTLRDSNDGSWRNKFGTYIAKVLDAIAPSGIHL